MVLTALDKAGGVRYLTQQAKSNPVAFMMLLGKVMPTSLVADTNGNQALGFILIPPKAIAPPPPSHTTIDLDPDRDPLTITAASHPDPNSDHDSDGE
jgi:hypothetical protein